MGRGAVRLHRAGRVKVWVFRILGGCRDDGAAGDRAANRADPGAGDGAGKGKIGRKLRRSAQTAAPPHVFQSDGNRGGSCGVRRFAVFCGIQARRIIRRSGGLTGAHENHCVIPQNPAHRNARKRLAQIRTFFFSPDSPARRTGLHGRIRKPFPAPGAQIPQHSPPGKNCFFAPRPLFSA